MFMSKPYTTSEAAKFLGVSIRTIYRLIEDKKLNPFRLNTHLRFNLSDLEKFKQENRIHK